MSRPATAFLRFTCWIYNGLNQKHPYTGRFLLGKDKYKSNLKYDDFYWSFKNVLSLEFENGKIISTEDYTEFSNQIRQTIYENKDGKKSIGFLEILQFQEMAEFWLENPPWWINNHVKNKRRGTV